MNEFDDRTLLRGPQLGEPASRAGTRGIIVVAVLGLALGGVGAWWWLRDRGTTPSPTAATSGTDQAIAPAAEPVRPLPPLHQMDTFLRALLGGLSSSPELARWLAGDDLIRLMADGIDRVSRGHSASRDATALRPPGLFAIRGSRQQSTIDPASFRRYDGIAAMVSSLDARSVADAYRTIQPRLDEAYRALGRSEGSVDDAVDVALQVLIDTPVVRGPLRVVPGTGATYAYADPELEGLPPAQKQLLRMGPDNVERIQQRLREIKQAIETSATR